MNIKNLFLSLLFVLFGCITSEQRDENIRNNTEIAISKFGLERKDLSCIDIQGHTYIRYCNAELRTQGVISFACNVNGACVMIGYVPFEEVNKEEIKCQITK